MNLEAAAEPMADESSEHEVCVPLAALAMPDENEVLENPAVGDAVQFNAEGHIARLEGDKAYIALKSVNGQELPKPEEAAEPSEQDQMAELEGMASKQPDRYA